MAPQRETILNTTFYPIPPNTVAHIAGSNGQDMRSYVLWKDGQAIVIQADPVIPNGTRFADIIPNNVEKYYEYQREYIHGLECIHSLINTIDFGKTNWGYLISCEGNYQIVQRHRRRPVVGCSTWAPLISEREIVFSSWFENHVNKRTGIWRGREVDVMLGYDDFFVLRLTRLMRSYKLLEGLDLTYEILAHIVGDDGTVVGVVTEPEIGRLIQYRDKIPLIEAIAKLRSRRLIFPSIEHPFVHVLNGKVRLTNLPALRYVEDSQEFEERDEKFHWAPMKAFFAYMDPGDVTNRLCWSRQVKTSFTLFSNNPSPERPLYQFHFGNQWKIQDGGRQAILRHRSKAPVHLFERQRNESTFFHGRYVETAHLGRNIVELTRRRAQRAVQPYSRQRLARKPLLITPPESDLDEEYPPQADK